MLDRAVSKHSVRRSGALGKGRNRMTRRGRLRVVLVSLITATAWMAIAPPSAVAAVILTTALPFPGSTVTVGQTNVPASLTITNLSTAPDATGTVTLTTVDFNPSCPDNTISPCTTPDLAVFSVSPTATGRAGTGCAGQLFTVSGPASDGTYTFTPTSPVVLGPPGSPTAACTIDFTFNVLRQPTIDSRPGDPGVQTQQVAVARGVSQAGSPATCCGGSTYLAVSAALALTFRSLTARAVRDGTLLRWRTGSEIHTLGFNLYREVSGKRARVNTRLIAADGRRSYSFLDRKAPRGKTVRYLIQVLNSDGSRSWHGPVRVSRT